jgi:sugar-specific transcriptional regulator TrmB
MNYERFNNFVDSYDERAYDEENSNNDERLQKALQENANDYLKRSEFGSSLLQGGQFIYQGREVVGRAEKTLNEIKKVPDKIRQGIQKIQDVKDEIKTGVDELPNTIAHGKDTVNNMLQDLHEQAKETVRKMMPRGAEIEMEEISKQKPAGELSSSSRARLGEITTDSPTAEIQSRMKRLADEARERVTGEVSEIQPKIKPKIPSPQNEDELAFVKFNDKTIQFEDALPKVESSATKGLDAAESVSKSVSKTGELLGEEGEIGEITAETEAATGGVLSDIVLPVAAATMVGIGIADLFKNKPKTAPISVKNKLVVPPQFTQQKEALVSSAQLPR